MTIITRKVKLAAAPEPPFVGTRIAIETTDESPFWGFKDAARVNESVLITIDWGDGTVETFDRTLVNLTHEYAVAGHYEVRISDTVSSFTLSSLAGTCQTVYAPMICGVWSNAQTLQELRQFVFSKCKQMAELDLRETNIRGVPGYAFSGCTALTGLEGLPDGIREIGLSAFSGCTGLETVRFPNVVNISGTETSKPFSNCTALREIHFAEANKEALLASAAFQFDPEHLGSPNGVVMFDL